MVVSETTARSSTAGPNFAMSQQGTKGHWEVNKRWIPAAPPTDPHERYNHDLKERLRGRDKTGGSFRPPTRSSPSLRGSPGGAHTACSAAELGAQTAAAFMANAQIKSGYRPVFSESGAASLGNAACRERACLMRLLRSRQACL